MGEKVQRVRARQQPQETRAQILEAARIAVGCTPYRDLSVDGIMALTGHSRTVFYRHFDDLPSLLLALGQELVQDLGGVAETWSATEGPPGDSMEIGIRGMVEVHSRFPRLLPAIREASYHDVRLELAYDGYLETFRLLAQQTVERIQSKGKIAPDLDAAETARALILMMDGYMNRVFRDGTSAIDEDRIIRVLARIWRRAVYATD